MATVHSTHIDDLRRRPSSASGTPNATQIWRSPIARRL
jgi:hypothetical protein